jgi:hypothetical protein
MGLIDSANDQDFVEVSKIALPCMPLGGNQGFEVQIGHDIRVTVYSGSDLELVAHVIAAIRSVS